MSNKTLKERQIEALKEFSLITKDFKELAVRMLQFSDVLGDICVKYLEMEKNKRDY